MQGQANRDHDYVTRVLHFLAAVVVILAILMMYFYYQYPKQNIGLEQPIPFSHRVHAGVKEINCRFCHPFADRGERAGIPTVEKCFYCHDYVIPYHPQLAEERRHYQTGTAVPWNKVYFVPDFVQFHHQPHVLWANIDCQTCHGEVERFDRLNPRNFTMGFCISCHRAMNAQLDCWLACHH